MALFNNKLFIFSLLWTSSCVRAVISEDCYFPDGIQATDNTPCYKNGSVSVCCGPGFTCLSNGLCQQGQNLFRGTCTDSTWKDDACPGFCKSGRQLDNWISSCPSWGSGYFCCGSDSSCCKNSTLILDLGSGTVISTTSSTSTSTSTITSTSTLVSRSSTPTTETITNTSQQSTSTIASSQRTTTSSITPSIHVDDNHGSGTNVAVVAGIGVGIGIPVCTGIAAFTFFFCRRRCRQINSDELVSDFKSRELQPPNELELNGPRSEIGSTALYELPATRG